MADEVGITGRLAPWTVVTEPAGPVGTGIALGDDIAIELVDCVIAAELLADADFFAGVPFAACATATTPTITATITAATAAARHEALTPLDPAAGLVGAFDI